MSNIENKYLKYKQKYLDMKIQNITQKGGGRMYEPTIKIYNFHQSNNLTSDEQFTLENLVRCIYNYGTFKSRTIFSILSSNQRKNIQEFFESIKIPEFESIENPELKTKRITEYIDKMLTERRLEQFLNDLMNNKIIKKIFIDSECIGTFLPELCFFVGDGRKAINWISFIKMITMYNIRILFDLVNSLKSDNINDTVDFCLFIFLTILRHRIIGDVESSTTKKRASKVTPYFDLVSDSETESESDTEVDLSKLREIMFGFRSLNELYKAEHIQYPEDDIFKYIIDIDKLLPTFEDKLPEIAVNNFDVVVFNMFVGLKQFMNSRLSDDYKMIQKHNVTILTKKKTVKIECLNLRNDSKYVTLLINYSLLTFIILDSYSLRDTDNFIKKYYNINDFISTYYVCGYRNISDTDPPQHVDHRYKLYDALSRISILRPTETTFKFKYDMVDDSLKEVS
jgi:hypothetical protein